MFFIFDFAVLYVPVFFVSSPNIRDKRRASAFGERTNTIFISYSLRMRYAVEFRKPLGLPTHILFKTAGKVTGDIMNVWRGSERLPPGGSSRRRRVKENACSRTLYEP